MDQETLEYICNLLRRGTTKWKGRALCLQKARKKFRDVHAKTGKPIEKYYWQCGLCKEWFREETDMEVDHIKEVGAIPTSIAGLIPFILRMYCSVHNLMAVCIECHLKKTMKYNNARSRYKRKTPV